METHAQDTNRSVAGDDVRVMFKDPITWASESQARGKKIKRADDECFRKVRKLVSENIEKELAEITQKVSSLSVENEPNPQQNALGEQARNTVEFSDSNQNGKEEEVSELKKLLQQIMPAPGATQQEILDYAQRCAFLTPIGKVVQRVTPLRTKVIAYIEKFEYSLFLP